MAKVRFSRVALVALAVVAFPSGLRAQSRDTTVIVDAGTYAGEVVQIAKGSATRRGAHFWRFTSRTDGRVVGWNPSRLPVGVAFRPGRGISSGDSVAFWSIVDRMQHDLGVRVFRPVALGREDDPDDVVVVDTRQMGSDEGMTLVTWSSNGSLYDARVFFRSAETLHDAGVVTHEMMHALGFGHTSDRTSIMNANPTTERLTPADVALAQIALQSRLASERDDVWQRLALAVERESPRRSAGEGYTVCPDVLSNPFESDAEMRVGRLAVVGALGALSACSGREKNNKGPDTLAVPAAAVDTTTDRAAGATPRATAAPATGVDTPITRKIGSPAPAKH